MDSYGADAEPLRGQDLVAHQGEQWADQQGRSRSGIAQDPGGQEIDDALAPACSLDHEHALALVCGQVNCLPLAIAEIRRGTEHLLENRAGFLLLHEVSSLRET